MPYQFIGRTTNFKGKPLWEILGNLKNAGVGRLVIRNRFQRYKEPCFFKILKVAALPNPVKEPFKLNTYNNIEARQVCVLVERTFRGQKFEVPVQMASSTYKADFQLVPKDEEYKYLECDKKREEKIYPRTMEFPPLLRELIKRNMRAKKQEVTEDPQMEIQYNMTGHKIIRIAKEDETPSITHSIGLGTPATPELYANVKPI